MTLWRRLCGTERRTTALAASLTAAVAILPFLPGLLAGHTFYFRDLGLYFFPLRRFIVEGLRGGELRWWNPYVHEGEPLALSPIGYPLDLLQLVWPDERGFSLLLALHVPLAALFAFSLARGLGLARSAASLAGMGYALGGFALSSLNLYVYAQALAWAPLAVLGLMRAAAGGRRALPAGAAALALCTSSTGLEVAAQAFLVAAMLAPLRHGGWRRLAAAALLGLAAAALPLLVLWGSLGGSARVAGFTTDVVLAHSVHPLTLVQVAVGGLFGDTSRLAERWWGQNFFPRGFPYVLSLYLGPALLALAGIGVVRGRAWGRRLLLLSLLGVLVCLGRWAGWHLLLDAAPGLRLFRYPTKAFFTVHLAVVLLAALGLDALAGTRRHWRGLAWAAGTAGLLLASAPLLPRMWPGVSRWFVAGFFPPGLSWPARWERFAQVLADAAAGGALALAVSLVAVLAAAGRLRPAAAAAAAVALVAADLIRAGAGLNPTLPLEGLRPSLPVGALLPPLREGRVFTCDVISSRSYALARAARGERHQVWTTWALLDTLSPAFNVPLAVRSAYSEDLTMLVPRERVLGQGEGCGDVGAIVDRLRGAGVAHVLSLDPIAHPELDLRAVADPARLAPLRVHVYALAQPLPLRELRPATASRPATSLRDAGDVVEMEAETAAPALLVLREGYAPGWKAWVNGNAAGVERVDGRHLGVSLPAGRSRVRLRYRPPGLLAGAVLAGAAVLGLMGLWFGPSIGARRRSAAE